MEIVLMYTFVVDLPVTVKISFAHHLGNLLVGKVFSEGCYHHILQLVRRDEPVAIPVKHPECLANLPLRIRVLRFLCHHRGELREVDRSISLHTKPKQLSQRLHHSDNKMVRLHYRYLVS